MDEFIANLGPVWEYAKELGIEGVLFAAVLVILYQLNSLRRRVDLLVSQAETRDDMFRAGEEATHKQLGQVLDEIVRFKGSGRDAAS